MALTEALFGIEHLIKDVQYFFVPDYPHNDNLPNKNFTYKHVLKYVTKYNFGGKTFVHQIQTTKNKQSKFKNIPFINANTTTHVAAHLFSNLLKIKTFDFYGINKTKIYHPDLKNLDFSCIENDKEYKHLFNDFINKINKNFDKNTFPSKHWDFDNYNITFN